MRKDWKLYKLNEAYIVKDGTHDSPKYVDVGFPLITSKNLKNGILIYDKVKYITEEDYNNINKRSKVDIGDLLFAMIGTIGNPVIINHTPKFAIKNVALFKKKDNSIDFLKYFLLSKNVVDKMKIDAKGATQKFVSLGYLRDFQIPIPPLEEQQKIVEKLDKAFELIDQAKANIEQNIINAKELFQSKLDEVFSQKGDGWKNYMLKDVGKIVSGATPKTKVLDFWDGDIAWITPKDLGSLGEQKYILETSRKISQLGLNSCSAQLMPKGSVIMSSRAPIGHLGIATNNICTNQGCKSIVPNENINSEFIYYFLLKSKEALNKLGTGAVFPELSGKMFSEFIIPVPTLEIQEGLVTTLDEISELTNKLFFKYQQKLSNLEELRKSILEKAFKGELTN